jgi:flagellar basal-body rod protein FlgF
MIENTSLVALSRQVAMQREMSVIANNISNVNTMAFKADDMLFREYITEPRNAESPISFVLDVGTVRNFAQGHAMSTSNPLDIMISGEGFLSVITDSGVQYTRRGDMKVDSSGQLTNNDGNPILGEGNAPIVIDKDNPQLTISGDGTVSDSNGKIGRLSVVTFANNQDLIPTINGLYTTNQSAFPVDDTEIVQGFLEGSNVSAVQEITRMVELSRSYTATQNLMQSESEMRRRIITRLGRVALV